MMRRPFAVLATAALALVPLAVATPAAAAIPGCAIDDGDLTWGFKESFRGYIDGSIANGEWTVADGATYTTPEFGFSAADGWIDWRQPQGTVAFPGSVRFTGHGGILDTTIANPTIEFRRGAPTVLLLDVTGPTMDGDEIALTSVEFVSIDLAGQDLTPVDGRVTVDAAPTTLTADGATAFPNYEEGAAFDPLTVVIDIGDCDLESQSNGGDVVDGGGLVSWHLVLLATGLVLVAGVVVLVVVLTRRRP